MMDGVTVMVITDLSQQFRMVWDIYIKFYTAFIVVNMTGLGLVAEKIERLETKRVIMWAFIFQNVLSGLTALAIAAYSHDVDDRMSKLLTARVAMAQAATPETPSEQAARPYAPLLVRSTVPGPLGVWGGAANALGHVFFVVCWIAVGRQAGGI
jgi:hypothetical protein